MPIRPGTDATAGPTVRTGGWRRQLLGPLGILVLLEAQPGKRSELPDFLKEARELAVAEEGTASWYAFKISGTSYGIFDTFATDDARTNRRVTSERIAPRPARTW